MYNSEGSLWIVSLWLCLRHLEGGSCLNVFGCSHWSLPQNWTDGIANAHKAAAVKLYQHFSGRMKDCIDLAYLAAQIGEDDTLPPAEPFVRETRYMTDWY